MRLRPGTFIVLEGLDKTGKTTQSEAIEAAGWEPPLPLVTHMPSGETDLTRAIYEITEYQTIASPLARQLLHLACHAENLPALAAARRERGVVIDRWWWSTVAYGWFGGLRSQLSESAFFGAINMIWGGFEADVVFLFLSAHAQDSHNLSTVAEGYRWLAAHHPDVAVEIPAGSPESVTTFLLEELRRRALVEG